MREGDNAGIVNVGQPAGTGLAPQLRTYAPPAAGAQRSALSSPKSALKSSLRVEEPSPVLQKRKSSVMFALEPVKMPGDDFAADLDRELLLDQEPVGGGLASGPEINSIQVDRDEPGLDFIEGRSKAFDDVLDSKSPEELAIASGLQPESIKMDDRALGRTEEDPLQAEIDEMKA